ncbi:hypothetical protein amb1423 [Paramagnetospirillum magneticum AMB-1]|uniref:Uncharacterized protein n=1 Tax=Paramagnetospirillum magneticum (strain ATCC 700264 / AMB-1) TaxID=342108 RepID=Q2W7E8_PARM1|nr:hypothetical protein amb1423 [Paramagnetospirillum magneticum AMB-1]
MSAERKIRCQPRLPQGHPPDPPPHPPLLSSTSSRTVDTHLPQRGLESKWRNTACGLPAPSVTAARTWRSVKP